MTMILERWGRRDPKEEIRNLWRSLMRFGRQGHQPPQHLALAEEAVGILQDPTQDDDRRDWAERYLCGIERGDFADYQASRPRRTRRALCLTP